MARRRRTIAPFLLSREPREVFWLNLPGLVKHGIHEIARHERQSASWVVEQIVTEFFQFDVQYKERGKPWKTSPSSEGGGTGGGTRTRDTSPSTAGKLKFQQESAMNFIQTVVKPRKDRVLFATFDDQINLLQDFTDKLDLLDKAVYSVKKMGTQTALYDAIWQFCDEKMRTVPGRRVLLVVSDGEDTYSRANIRDAIDIAQRTETTIFAISTKAGFLATVPGVEAGQVADKKDRDLLSLAEETGGAAFFTGDMLSLERSFTRISKELRAQYLVTYNPTNKSYDGTFRKIDVKLTQGKGDLKVRTKRGYKAIADSVRP